MQEKMLGKYRIIEEIGRGGFSVVYLGEDPALGKKIVIKLLLPAMFHDSGVIARFIHEARTVAALDHDNIVRVLDLDESDGRLFMVMPFVQGRDLNFWIQEHGVPGFQTNVRIIEDIAAALDYAHSQGIVHGDVKPGNILMDDSVEPRARLGDFGVLRAVEHSGATSGDLTAGTPHYISPEQADGKPSTILSDQYSLGILAYELFTGQVPFDADTTLAIYLKHIREDPARPETLNSVISSELAEVMLKPLVKDPQQRYPDCSTFAKELRRAVAHMESQRVADLLRQAQRAVDNHQLAAAREKLGDVLRIMPEMEDARELLKSVENLERADREYASIKENVERAQALVKSLDEDVPEAQTNHLVQLIRHGQETFFRKWKPFWMAMVILAGLAILFGLGAMIYTSSNSGVPVKNTLVAYRRTSTPTFTSTVTLTPTATSTFTPTPTYTYTPTFTPTPVLFTFENADKFEVLYTLPVGESVYKVQFSPDGKYLAAGLGNGDIQLWRTVDWNLERTLSGHSRRINNLAFSPNSKLLASGSYDENVRLWIVETGEEFLPPFQELDEAVSDVVFSPDGSSLAVSSEEGEIWLWEINKTENRRVSAASSYSSLRFTHHSLAFSPDGAFLGSGYFSSTPTYGNKVIFWDFHSLRLVTEISIDESRNIEIVNQQISCPSYYSVYSKTLTLGDTKWQLYSTTRNNVIVSMNNCVLISPIYSNRLTRIKLENMNTSKEAVLAIGEGHTSGINDIDQSPNGLVLASGSSDWTIRIWGYRQWYYPTVTPTPTLTPTITLTPTSTSTPAAIYYRLIEMGDFYAEAGNLPILMNMPSGTAFKTFEGAPDNNSEWRYLQLEGWVDKSLLTANGVLTSKVGGEKLWLQTPLEGQSAIFTDLANGYRVEVLGSKEAGEPFPTAAGEVGEPTFQRIRLVGWVEKNKLYE